MKMSIDKEIKEGMRSSLCFETVGPCAACRGPLSPACDPETQDSGPQAVREDPVTPPLHQLIHQQRSPYANDGDHTKFPLASSRLMSVVECVHQLSRNSHRLQCSHSPHGRDWFTFRDTGEGGEMGGKGLKVSCLYRDCAAVMW